MDNNSVIHIPKPYPLQLVEVLKALGLKSSRGVVVVTPVNVAAVVVIIVDTFVFVVELVVVVAIACIPVIVENAGFVCVIIVV